MLDKFSIFISLILETLKDTNSFLLGGGGGGGVREDNCQYRKTSVVCNDFSCFNFRNRQVNHARNVWDRAVTILPRANQFWYKYTYMEEMLGNIAGKNCLHPNTNAMHCQYQHRLMYLQEKV